MASVSAIRQVNKPTCSRSRFCISRHIQALLWGRTKLFQVETPGPLSASAAGMISLQQIKLTVDAIVEVAGLNDVPQTGCKGDIAYVNRNCLGGRVEARNFQSIRSQPLPNVETVEIDFV